MSTPIKVYLAAPWVCRDAARGVAKDLEAAGYSITRPWWDMEAGWEEHDKLAHHAEEDVAAVVAADVMVVLDYAKSEGKSFEQGVAKMCGLHIIGVRKDGVDNQNIFHHLDNYTWVNSPAEAIDELARIIL